jgi:capsular exopolysaccharide synthesis family protein
MYRQVNKKNKKNSEIDWINILKTLYGIFLKHIYLFLISALVALLIANLYIKYSGQVYEIYTSLMIEEERNNRTPNSNFTMDMVSTNITSLLPGNNNIENQIYVLGSYNNLFKTIKKIDKKIEYFQDKLFINKRIIKNIPFTVELNTNVPQLSETDFELEIIDDKTYNLKVASTNALLYDFSNDTKEKVVDEINYEGVHYFGKTVASDYFSFKLKKNIEGLAGQKFTFVIKNPEVLTNSLKSNINIDRVNLEAGVVRISLMTKYPKEGIKTLKAFTDVYLQNNINKKNAVVDKMIDFIESQFDKVATSLKVSEDTLQFYQSRKNVVDLAAQGQIIIEQVNVLENEKAEIATRLVYLKNLKKNIVSGNDHSSMVAPNVMGIDDVVLNNLVNRINEINIQRSALVSGLNNAGVNPQVIAMDAQLKELKKSLVDNVDNIISQIRIFSKNIERRIFKNKNLLKELPSKQRGLVNIQRNNQINSELYSNLLERKLNYYIMKASNILDKDVVDEARLAEKIPFRSKKEVIYLFALFWGFMLPMGSIVLINLFDSKIKSKEDIESITDKPLMGIIPQVRKDDEKKISNYPLSVFSESYRLVRYRLGNFGDSRKCLKIMVTSTLPKEGKTLTSLNIATAFAMLNKKTIVVGCDLRKPALGKILNLKEDIGLSTYLEGDSTVNNIIKNTENKFLDAIVSGHQPLNPSELIGGEKLKKLISELEKRYDYIILDTPPLGIVSDALFLTKYVDLKLLIVRSGTTEKKAFAEIIDRLAEDKIENIGIIFNGERYSRQDYYGYKYVKYKY